MNFPDSRMYHTTEGISDEQFSACKVVMRDNLMVVEYVDEAGSRNTYQAVQTADGQFNIRQELEGDDYLFTATLNRQADDLYEGQWHQRYGTQHKQGTWSIELA
ncbi:hypothetical protein [Pseudomonas caspiana]|uniref:hypothetical protein n=1 Tax=Pseudomonas caspiana TaxID=1451454 RepID=UPI0032EF3F43